MRFLARTTIFVFFLLGLVIDPDFVNAGYDCYVDAGAESGGDGSESKPYSKIEKALGENCKDIYVKKGSYKDDITLGSGVRLKGSNRSDVIITGKVTMNDESRVENVSVQGLKGIYLSSGADAKVISVDIKGTATGIETLGGGKLTVEKCKIHSNGKGLYIQYGKEISITSSEIYDNTEEGIDIRANVDGVISGNVIEDNKESGIEVILGKAQLTISNNKIKNNKSSGIATQFYDSTNKTGKLKINNNTISGNSQYAVNCKTPSGGDYSEGYWEKSISLIGNTISGNKDGDFASKCKFEDITMDGATKTKEELAVEEKARLESIERQKAAPGEIVGKVKISETSSGYLNVREGYSVENKIITTVKPGEEYGYSNKENGWYKISISDQLWGWVSGAFAEEVIKEELPVVVEEKIVEEKLPETVPEPEPKPIDNIEDEQEIPKNILIFGGAILVALVSVLSYLLYNKYFKNYKKKIEIMENNENIDIN